MHQFYESQALHMEDIYTAFRKSGIAFTKSQAIKIVGGRTRLERLVMQKKSESTYPAAATAAGNGNATAKTCSGTHTSNTLQNNDIIKLLDL